MDRFTDWLLSLPTAARMALFACVALAVLTMGYLSMAGYDDGADTEPSDGPTPQVGVIPDASDTLGTPSPANAGPTDTEWTMALPLSQPVLNTAAVQAAEFTEEFLSYRYDQNDAAKQRRVARMLATHHTIDLSSITPTGAARDQMLSSRTVVTVKVTAVEAVMVSAAMLGVDVTVEETTTQEGQEPQQETRSYALTLSRGNTGWDVSEMYAEGGSPFLDETG